MKSVTLCEPNGSGDSRTVVERSSTSGRLPRLLLQIRHRSSRPPTKPLATSDSIFPSPHVPLKKLMRAIVMARQRSRKASRSRADAISLAKDVRDSVESERPMRLDTSAPLSTTQVVRNGLVRVLSAVYYAVSGSIGLNARSLSPKIITMDTGSEYARSTSPTSRPTGRGM